MDLISMAWLQGVDLLEAKALGKVEGFVAAVSVGELVTRGAAWRVSAPGVPKVAGPLGR
jgi:hypothetical protein